MKKLGIITLVAITALGLLGLSYAAWTEGLSVGGSVGTGNLAATIDVDTDGGGLQSSTAYATINKDVSSTLHDLIVSIGNAAPSNIFTIHYLVTNTGTVPINVTLGTPSVTVNSGADATEADLAIDKGTDPGLILDTNGTKTGVITITVQDSTPNNESGNSYSVTVPLTAEQQ